MLATINIYFRHPYVHTPQKWSCCLVRPSECEWVNPIPIVWGRLFLRVSRKSRAFYLFMLHVDERQEDTDVKVLNATTNNIHISSTTTATSSSLASPNTNPTSTSIIHDDLKFKLFGLKSEIKITRLWYRISCVDHDSTSKTAFQPSSSQQIDTRTSPVSILKRLVAFGWLFRAKIDYFCLFCAPFPREREERCNGAASVAAS
jgi:hypothetical protein